MTQENLQETPNDFPSRYEHLETEEKIYKLWENSGCFNPDNLPSSKSYKLKVYPSTKIFSGGAKSFCIIMPPPNANGSLHIGHAVFVTLQDIMIRFARMQGKKTLWLPGADHAGFETQVVYDKKLEKENRSRNQISREKLWQEIWDFTQENKKIMEHQLRKLGASCDWTREKFTLDHDIIKIVYETFKRLYDDGLIYRSNRIVNWCTKHQTTLSDLEIKHIEEKAPLYFIRYGPITLATVRLETKFGDTAIAVHPKDKRYQKFIGKEIEIQTLLGIAKIKVIADEAVSPEFGTGAVKVTPAHDLNDFEIWQRHIKEIPEPFSVIDQFGRMDLLSHFPNNPHAKKYHGLKILEARKIIENELQKEKLMEKIDINYTHNVATCYKCDTIVEPRIMPQWYVRMTAKPHTQNQKSKCPSSEAELLRRTDKSQNVGKSLRDLGIWAVKSGKIKFIPKRTEKIFFHWLKNLRDWNISRQIVWGIRIPAWYCKIRNPLQKKMGWHQDVVPQVFDGKTTTWRLRDHGFDIGNIVVFENSQTSELFGYGKITNISKTTVGKINLKDKKHYKTYRSCEELIKAFEYHNPNREVNENTPVFVYEYEFKKIGSRDGGCGRIVVNIEKPKQCPNCGSSELTQDPDVFDTWFSSGQWPFATLGYPNNNDYKTFYPTTVMETGSDILFFWVARMIMLGIYVIGKIPFKYVYLHGMVRDKDRQKMSKSKGNVIDPLGIAETYGTDAMRMALVVGNTPGQDIIISEDKIRGYRNFATKIWNAARFIFISLSKDAECAKDEKRMFFSDSWKTYGFVKKQTRINLSASDIKNLKDLEKIKNQVAKDIENFRFHQAAETIYHYFWHTFADKIIESAKPRLHSQNEKDKTAAIFTLITILKECLKMLHPFMPFITEEIYQKLQGLNVPEKKLLITENW